jgi:protein-tyrosine phosphatase
MAEYLLRHRLGSDAPWRVGSAGISAIPGLPASEPAVTVMDELGINIRPHRSRLLTRDLAESADMIVVMTGLHKLAVSSRFPTCDPRVYLLRSFDSKRGGDVTDPIGLSVAIYRRTRQDIDDALLDLILFLKRRPAGGLGAEGSSS